MGVPAPVRRDTSRSAPLHSHWVWSWSTKAVAAAKALQVPFNLDDVSVTFHVFCVSGPADTSTSQMLGGETAVRPRRNTLWRAVLDTDDKAL
jgi:hypothetical protein